MSHGVKSNKLFHTLHQRYGQSLIKEVRSLEGKEHKLVRFKQHRVFNLRCLKENVVPKSVKINFKQFKPLNERKILCKTHRQILNSRVRKTNKTIDKFNKDIELLRSNIKNIISTSHFESITDAKGFLLFCLCKLLETGFLVPVLFSSRLHLLSEGCALVWGMFVRGCAR